MTNKIIALVDGSIYSESVCHHTAWAAKKLNLPVELYHVLGRREASGHADLSGSIRLGARTKLLEELSALDEQRSKLSQARGRAILEDAKALIEKQGIDGVATRLRHGDLLETISAVEKDMALTVIGKRGEAADFAKMHLGSNLERIVRASKKPVLVASRAFKSIDKILIAFDGRSFSLKAVDFVARNPLFTGLDITLVTIGNPIDRINKSLEDAKATLLAGGHTVNVRVMEGVPDKVLGTLVQQEAFDLIVMGAYSKSRFTSMIIGSTSTEMIRACLIPILLMK